MEDSEFLKEGENQNNLEVECDEFSANQPIIEQILNKNGYNWKIWSIFLLVGSLVMIDGLASNTFSLMLIPFQKYFQLTELELQIISGVLPLGVGLGSIVSGYISSKFYRPPILNSCVLMMALLHLTVAFLTNKIILGICRLFIGITLGLYIPICQNILAEYLPVRYRAFMLNLVWIGYNIGAQVLCYTLLIIMPNLEADKIKPVFITFSIILIIIFLFNLLFLRDSPRNFLIKNYHQEGFRILEELYNKPLKEEYRERILNELKFNNEIKSLSISELFNYKFRMTTILISLFCFMIYYGSNGLSVISTISMKKFGFNGNASNHQIIENLSFICLIMVPFLILGGFLCEVNFIGRKKTVAIACLISSLTSIFCIIIPSLFPVFFAISISCFTVSINVNIAYISEIYATKFRDLSSAYFFLISKIGACLSSIIYLKLVTIDKYLPYYSSCAVALVGAICSLCLPYETNGMPLDIDFTQNNEKEILRKDSKKRDN